MDLPRRRNELRRATAFLQLSPRRPLKNMDPSERPRILFAINSMSGGGAERVMSRLLSLSERLSTKFDLSLAVLDREPIAYAVPSFVKVYQLDCRGSLWRSIVGLRGLTQRLKPELTVSFLTRANVATCLIPRDHSLRRVISERINTSAHLGSGLRSSIVKCIVRWAYSRADRIIAVSQGIAEDLREKFALRKIAIDVIANPVEVDSIRREGSDPLPIALPKKFVVAVGRLVPSKNLTMLLRAFAAAQLEQTSLVVIGDGPERERLAALSEELGIADKTIFTGFLANPYAVMARADAFALPSNVEGFPNALVEAMALGLPVVSTNCPDGPAEILAGRMRGEVNGLTVGEAGIIVPCDDVSLFAKGLRYLFDPLTRGAILEGAKRRLMGFEPASIAARYWAIIENEVGHSRALAALS